MPLHFSQRLSAVAVSGADSGQGVSPRPVTGAEEDRASWITLLGARRDTEASWTWREATPATDGAVSQTLELTSFGTRLDCVLLRPAGRRSSLPLILIPYYDVEVPLGAISPRMPAASPSERRRAAWAPALVARGNAVLIVPWWCETLALCITSESKLELRYGPIATEHQVAGSQTGLGRAVGDLIAALDAVTELPWIDPGRIGGFGHSLGAKLMMTLAAFDQRVRATVVHEPGLGFRFSNWDAPWYLGEKIPTPRDLDDLISLIAPRRLLYIGGDEFDGEQNRQLALNALALAGGPRDWMTLWQHHGGHEPPVEIASSSFEWLAAILSNTQ